MQGCPCMLGPLILSRGRGVPRLVGAMLGALGWLRGALLAPWRICLSFPLSPQPYACIILAVLSYVFAPAMLRTPLVNLRPSINAWTDI